MELGIVTVFTMTFGITSLGVGLSAVFPRFKHENVAQIPTGFGGIVYMLVTMLFIGAVIIIEACLHTAYLRSRRLADAYPYPDGF